MHNLLRDWTLMIHICREACFFAAEGTGLNITIGGWLWKPERSFCDEEQNRSARQRSKQVTRTFVAFT